jgi:hypothetical protein
MKPVIKYIYLIVFSVLISGIGVLTVLNIGKTSEDQFIKIEKRNPVNKPKWEWDPGSMDSYFLNCDSYLNDDFSLRSYLTGLYSRLLFSVGVSSKPEKVVLGKNGILFLGNDFNRVLDQTAGKRMLTDEEFKQLKKYFTLRKLILDSLGIPMYLTIIPNKETVYSEYLPFNIKYSKNNFLSQIMNLNFGIDIISLEKALIEGKNKYDDHLFYKTDNHWSEIGAYIAYVDLIKQLSPKFPKIHPLILEKENFIIKPYFGRHDLKDLLYLKNSIEDFSATMQNIKGWDTGLVKIDSKGNIKEIDSTQVVTTFEQCVVVNSHKPYTLLLFKDSFSWCLSPYLNNTFGKIIYCYYQNFGLIQFKELVKKYKPDLVIYETIQRDLLNYVWLSNKSDSEIIEAKDNKWSSACILHGRELFDGVKSTYQVEDLEVVQNKLYFKATGNDPQIILPSIDLPKNQKIRIKVELYSPKETTVQLYYVTGKGIHNGKQCINRNIMRGFSTIDFILPENNINGSMLRLDPGFYTGRYEISLVEYFVSD